MLFFFFLLLFFFLFLFLFFLLLLLLLLLFFFFYCCFKVTQCNVNERSYRYQLIKIYSSTHNRLSIFLLAFCCVKLFSFSQCPYQNPPQSSCCCSNVKLLLFSNPIKTLSNPLDVKLLRSGSRERRENPAVISCCD